MMMQHSQSGPEDGVPGSRCFVVCGKAITGEELQTAFNPYGEVQSVKVVREKGVAYVKYDKASAAALAIENLNGAVLNNGRGPKLKVLLAEAPSSRGMAQQKQTPELELSSDPDNVPPRSRLFIVVPKLCEAQQIQDDMGQFPDIEYCKTDLAASRGVVFCKFSKSSSALRALEAIGGRGMKVAGYTVKAMLAEPKTKRGRPEASPQDLMYGMQQNRLDYSLNGMDPLKLQMNSGLQGGHMGMGLHDFAASGGLSGLGIGINSFSTLANSMNNMNNMGNSNNFNNMNNMNNLNNMNNMNNLQADMMGAQGLALMSNLAGHNSVSPGEHSVSPNNLAGVPLSKQRLFVVVHKGVTEDAIARLFRRFPGMEYCDLKKERATGKSKGYCYVNYSTPDAAGSAVEQLNGMEFPPHSGHRIKVMYAEPMGIRSGGSNGAAPTPTIMPSSVHSSAASLPSRSPGMLSMHGGSMQASTPSASHTPLSRSTGMGTVSGGGMGPITPDTVVSVSDSLAGMALHHIAATLPNNPNGVDDSLERAAVHLTSPVAPAVARELMFNVN